MQLAVYTVWECIHTLIWRIMYLLVILSVEDFFDNLQARLQKWYVIVIILFSNYTKWAIAINDEV